MTGRKILQKKYLEDIKCYCLVMSENYIKTHFDDIKKYAKVIENRLEDDWCTMESVLDDNAQFLALAKKYNTNFILIDDKYKMNIEL